MSTAKFHALAAASAMIRKQGAPKGARAWARALPSLEVCVYHTRAMTVRECRHKKLERRPNNASRQNKKESMDINILFASLLQVMPVQIHNQ